MFHPRNVRFYQNVGIRSVLFGSLSPRFFSGDCKTALSADELDCDPVGMVTERVREELKARIR